MLSKINIYNFAFFQGAWLACVMLASPWALITVAPFVIVQLVWGGRWQSDMRTGVVFVLLGALAESFLLGTGNTLISDTVGDIPPLWLLCLWFCFGVSTQYSLAWLRQFKRLKVLWQALLCAVLAPIAYLGAERLGAIAIAEQGLFAIAIVWGLTVPLCLLMTDRERHEPETV